MRTGRVLVAAAVALAALLFALLPAHFATTDVRFPSGTQAPPTSGRGDIRPCGGEARLAPRRSRTADESPVVDESSAPNDTTAETADEPEPPPPPSRVLQIVDERGAPLPGVSVDGPFNGWRCRDTDADGETQVDVVEPATRVSFVDGAETRTFDLRELRTVVVVKSPLRLDVSVVDATSGVALDPVRYELERGRRASTTEWTCGPRPAVWRDVRGEATFAVLTTPPAGFGGYRRIEWSGEVAERARVVRFVVPVFEATERTLRVRRADGGPAAGATIERACVAEGHEWSDREASIVTWTAESSDAAGVVRVRGLPRIPFTRTRVDVAWRFDKDGEQQALFAVVHGLDLSAPPPIDAIDVVLGAAEEDRWPTHGPPGCGGADRVEGPTAALALRVRHRDGAPARRVKIETDHGSTWTDGDGRARFDALPVGRAPFVAYAHGFAPTRFDVDVGATESVDVVEVESRPVRVVVRDEAGRPVPSALVLSQVGFMPWSKEEGSRWIGCSLAQLDGDVEDVAPRTDRTGAVVLRLPKYEVELDASLGGAKACRYSSADEVEITLREPDRKPKEADVTETVEEEATDSPR